MAVRRWVLGAASAVLLAQLVAPAAVSAPDDVQAAGPFIRSAGNRLTALTQDSPSPEERHRRLRAFLDEVADVDGVARFCLGRFWRIATPAQQQEYLALFRDVLTNSVAARVNDYPQGQSQVTIQSAVRNGATIEVPTLVAHPTHSAQARVTWVLSSENGSLRIIDVVAEGMSLRLTQRSDYQAFLGRNNNDVGALLRALRQQVAGH